MLLVHRQQTGCSVRGTGRRGRALPVTDIRCHPNLALDPFDLRAIADYREAFAERRLVASNHIKCVCAIGGRLWIGSRSTSEQPTGETTPVR